MRGRKKRIPQVTVARLPLYVQGLELLAREGVQLTSSQRLAAALGVEASQIRRDLSYLGAFGVPGVGYDVRELVDTISKHLGASRLWPVALVGRDEWARVLAAYDGLPQRNFRVVVVFDPDSRTHGADTIEVTVHPLEAIPTTVKEKGIEIAIIATSSTVAQAAADMLVAAGVTSILNLAPTSIAVPEGVVVRNIDLAREMQILSFHETTKEKTDVRRPLQPTLRERPAGISRER